MNKKIGLIFLLLVFASCSKDDFSNSTESYFGDNNLKIQDIDYDELPTSISTIFDKKIFTSKSSQIKFGKINSNVPAKKITLEDDESYTLSLLKVEKGSKFSNNINEVYFDNLIFNIKNGKETSFIVRCSKSYVVFW
tara:strand:+ start:910 stop:1320 length:411 start_codon:yes stop_codon:yes gene_type:complete